MYYSDYDRPRDDGTWQGPAPAPQAGFPPNSQPPVAQPPARRRRTWPRILALVLCCAIVGAAAGAGGSLLTQQALRANPDSTITTVFEGSGSPTVVNLSKIEGGQVLTPAEVYASNVNSTVGIVTQVTTNIWGQQVAQAASGSGFVLTQDGYIVTNYHVIEDATSITVKFYDGKEFPAKLVGSEESNDVAVLKIEATGLTPVRLGSSEDLVVGEDVVAIGNPLGELTFTETRGIVSALDRTITMSDGTAINTLQTDCAINSGNSGGPLFNMYGQVIGITNAKYSNNGDASQASIEGICFAIPIDDVKGLITDIIEHGYVTGKPYMGVTLSTANATEAARYGRSGGAYVQSVVPGSAADQAGLRRGDIITAVDGETVEGHAQFIEIKDAHKAGDTVTLTVDREGKTVTLTLTFAEQKPGDTVGRVDGDFDDDSGSQDGGSYGYPYGFPYGYPPYGFGW